MGERSGAVAPLLQTDPPFPRARITSDVDGVIASSTHTESERVRQKLAARGFRQVIEQRGHVNRWIGLSRIPFDLVWVGEHLQGSGNPWDAIAIKTAVEATLGRGRSIRHASAPSFLAQKWAAFHDRGRRDPLGSRDLEDIWRYWLPDRRSSMRSLPHLRSCKRMSPSK